MFKEFKMWKLLALVAVLALAEAATNKPSINSHQQPATHKPATQRPTTHRPVVHRATTHKPVAHNSNNHAATTHRPNTNNNHAATKQPAAHQLHQLHPVPVQDSKTQEELRLLKEQQADLKQTIEVMGRQLMQQQTDAEERTRSDGMSGVKTLRHLHGGTKPYFGDSHIGGSALSAHDHADFDRTIGLGEFVAVLNGVEFRTRHNDYKLRSSSTSSNNFNAIEDVKFPDVPPQVKNKKTVQEQIDEMRLWFKAFHDQDDSVRDFKKYFKPNLCYLEGAWTLNTKTLNEPFQSDRHHIDATSWFDLQEKIRFTSYGGSKSNLENFAYLPTTMYNITDGIPQFAQWNYRILCHPVKQHVPTGYFQVQDDLSYRLARKMRWDSDKYQDIEKSRAARYKLNEFGTDRFNTWSFLDSVMAEIPGKDNYGANLTDDSFGLLNYRIDDPKVMVPLNTGMYHRWFKLGERSAMGITVNHRGYHDENMWVAHTTQPAIMPMSIRHCVSRQCSWSTKRVSYAIPLEMIYTTPLSNWNPYNLHHWEGVQGNAITQKNGRNGAHDARHAYNGTSYRHFYRTPIEFYKGNAPGRDPADTARNAVGVLDSNNTVRMVAPTGTRVITPNIDGVGAVRLRYPIFPVHSEGSTVGMELMALRETVMKMGRYSYLYEETPMGQPLPPDHDYTFHVRDSARNPPGLHGHEFTLTSDEYQRMMNGTHLTVTTSFNLGHQHEMQIYYNKNQHKYYWELCDGSKTTCWDGHAHALTL